MAGSLRTLAVIDAEIAALQAKLTELAGLPDSATIGPNSYSGASKAYEQVKDRLDELCAERDSLINAGGCRRPSRMMV